MCERSTRDIVIKNIISCHVCVHTSYHNLASEHSFASSVLKPNSKPNANVNTTSETADIYINMRVCLLYTETQPDIHLCIHPSTCVKTHTRNTHARTHTHTEREREKQTYHTHIRTHTHTHTHTSIKVWCVGTYSSAIDQRHLDLQAETKSREEWFHVCESEYRLA